MIGAGLDPFFGMTMTVCSLTPSRIGISTTLRSWSNASVTGEKVLGISL
jgi:hypothetical protein